MRTLIRHTVFATLGLAIGLYPVKNASASLIATGTFTTPTGTVSATDNIPVFITLSLDQSSDPLITDSNGNVISSYSIADVEANLFSNLPPAWNLPSIRSTPISMNSLNARVTLRHHARRGRLMIFSLALQSHRISTSSPAIPSISYLERLRRQAVSRLRGPIRF
jgi:hypothetical protein